MKKIKGKLLFYILLIFFTIKPLLSESEFKIGFGSCLDQDMSYKILDKITGIRPDLFIFMGDNIYFDSENANDKIPAYEKWTKSAEFLRLKNSTKLLYTWDDHDFGVNDAGADYKDLEKSKEIFLQYIDESSNSPRRKRKGVYESYEYQFSSKKILIILLDTRTFRSNFKTSFWNSNKILPNLDPNATVLGKEQWDWLDRELQKKVDLRILVSSIQFHNDYHKFEKWGNFPLEKEKLFSLLRKDIRPTLIFSGDRHIGEFHKMKIEGLPLIYEITSSPLNRELTFPTIEPFHPDRIGNFVQESNFGLLRLIPEKKDLLLSMEIHLLSGLIMQKKIFLSEIK